MTEDRLQKVLELERARRFGDRAVTSGLDSFVRNITTNEGGQLSSHVFARLQSLPVGGYRSMTPAARKKWVEETLAAIKAQGNGNGQEAGRAVGKAPGKAAYASPAEEARAAHAARETARREQERAASTGDGKKTAPRKAPKPRPQPKQPTVLPRPTEGEIEALGVDSPITALRRVTFGLAVKFDKLEIHTIRDLLLMFPRRHVDYGQPVRVADLEPGREQTVRAQVWSTRERQIGFRMRGAEATIGDSSGMMRVLWFNQPWIAKQLPVNAEIVVAGKVSARDGRPQFDNPEWEVWSPELMHTGRLVPIYPLTAGLQNRTVRAVMRDALDRFVARLPDPLPPEMRDRLGLMNIADAVTQMHYPTDRASLDAARYRLSIEELLPIQLTMLLRRRYFQQSAPAEPMPLSAPVERAFKESLPFTLTSAQERVLFDVLNDARKPLPMSRLIQGDVGSGKTVIAAAALVAAAQNGRQAVMMAPTEILAEQHFRTLKQLFGGEFGAGNVVSAFPSFLGRSLRIAMLTGALKAKERTEIYGAIERGEVDIICGTHALIQGGVRFHDLGIAVVDEQHRFGVMQRAALREKGSQGAHTPHMLVMTATPIPRTLALTIYGDLDVSVVDELPPGRQPIKTTWVGPDERGDAERFVRAQVEQGRQAFVICPLVEESETLDVKSATAEYNRLRTQVYPDLRLELLHGRMSAKQKDAIMRRFRAGEADILVSTAVIEVGIDIPNASVMLIEGADRFGLAQLHQFRGRVGRGAEQSYCLLLSEEPSEDAQKRLELMEETSDGFKLAEADMEIRGPGQFFGTKQSGLPGLKVAKLTDVKLIETSRNEAARLLDDDPGLTKPPHHALNIKVRAYMESDRVVDEEH